MYIHEEILLRLILRLKNVFNIFDPAIKRFVEIATSVLTMKMARWLLEDIPRMSENFAKEHSL
jgi:hypothetical protein